MAEDHAAAHNLDGLLVRVIAPNTRIAARSVDKKAWLSAAAASSFNLERYTFAQKHEDDMSQDKHDFHIYGMPVSPPPPAPEGLRGEGSAPLADPPAEQTHAETAEGRPITVVETSGTAFVEATGNLGLKKNESSSTP